MEISDYYKSKIAARESELKLLTRRSRWLPALKLTSFALLAGSLYLCFATESAWWAAVLSGAFLCLYLYGLTSDTRQQSKIQANKKIRAVYAGELAYLHGDYSAFADGSRYADASHPFTFDLDIFGKDSLFNRINRTVTQKGSDKLAEKLQALLADRQAVELRRDAVKELAESEQWRTTFLALGCKPDVDLDRTLKVLKDNFEKRTIAGRSLLIAMTTSVAIMLSFIILAICSWAPVALPVTWFALQLLVCVAYMLKFNKISNEATLIFKGFSGYALLIEHILSVRHVAAVNSSLQNRLSAGGSAMAAFKSLSSILNSLEQRANVLVYALLNGLCLYDLFLLRRLVVWKGKYLHRMDTWIDAIAEFDSLVSLATYRFNSPAGVEATVKESEEVAVNAAGLYHPFIPRHKAVANDFLLKKSSFAIVTGANMAGKSTFLRAVGVSYILAVNGLPVCASRFEVSILSLFSSMRISDNLSGNVSYFNAELTRLEKLIRSCKEHAHTLIMLDEILRGTNSKDKLEGATLFLREIAKLNVSGIVATHDLGLAMLEQQAPERFKCYCFEIALSDKMAYTFKISRGVAKNMNATYLVRKIVDKIGEKQEAPD